MITRLLRGEDRFSHESEWFTLNDARLQLLPLQEDLPMVTASSISPSGMTLAGKYGMGVLSIASNSTAGLQALPTQWSFAEDAAAEHGQTVDRKNWRVMLAFHIAETREQARNEAVDGLHRWHNEYNVWTLGRPNATHVDDKWELLEQTVGDGSPGAGSGVIGTPDDLVAAIRHLQEITGGFGVVLGFAHDWANREATMRSWDLVARYVIPELNGHLTGLRESQEYLNRHQAELMAGASKAVVSKILANDKAAAAMQTTMEQAAQAAAAKEPSSRSSAPAAGSPRPSTDQHPARQNRLRCVFGDPGHRTCNANGVGQSSLRATAFGVTFIFGSYSATSTTRPSARNMSRRALRHVSQGP